jgi:hypothetical protein
MARFLRLLFQPPVLVVLTAFACHAVLPFTDYRAGEDHYLVNWVTRQRYDDVMEIYSETGRTFSGWFFWSFHWVPALTPTFKVIGVLVSAASGLLLYALAVRTRFVCRLEALFLAVVTVAFPADKLLGGFMYSKPEICFFAFLLGGWATLLAEARSGLRHWLFRLLALLLFSVAFLTESLLMYFGGFFLLLVLLRQRDTGLKWYRFPWGYCFRRLDLIALPFLWWLARVTLTPSYGPFYSNVNQPAFDVTYLARYLSLPDVFFDPALLVWGLSIQTQMVLAGLTVLTAIFVIAAARHVSNQGKSSAGETAPAAGASAIGRSLRILFFGLVLLVLGTVPYVALNKAFTPTGQACRYAALTPLPLALILLAGGTLIRPLLGRTLLHGMSAAVAGCLVIWCATWWHNDLSLQAVQVRNDAIFRQVHADPRAREWCIYMVQNPCTIPRTIDTLNNWQWAFQEAGVAGEPRSIAFIPQNLRPHSEEEVEHFIWISTIPYAMTGIDPAGKQGLVIVRVRDTFRVTRTALKYLFLKHCKPERLDAFLDSVVEVEFYPAPWDPALVSH